MNKLFKENRLINFEGAKAPEQVDGSKEKAEKPEKVAELNPTASRKDLEVSIAARGKMPSNDENANETYRNELNKLSPLNGEQQVKIIQVIDTSLDPNSKLEAALKMPLDLLEARLKADATRNLRLGAPATISGSFDLGPIVGSIDFESTPQTGENLYLTKSLTILDKPIGIGDFGMKGAVMFDAATKDVTINGTIELKRENTTATLTHYQSARGKSDNMEEIVVSNNGFTGRATFTPKTGELVATVGYGGTF